MKLPRRTHIAAHMDSSIICWERTLPSRPGGGTPSCCLRLRCMTRCSVSTVEKLCVCVHGRRWAHARMQVCSHAGVRGHVCAHVYMCANTSLHMYTNACMWARGCAYACSWSCVWVCLHGDVYTLVCVCACLCIHADMCMHTCGYVRM